MAAQGKKNPCGCQCHGDMDSGRFWPTSEALLTWVHNVGAEFDGALVRLDHPHLQLVVTDRENDHMRRALHHFRTDLSRGEWHWHALTNIRAFWDIQLVHQHMAMDLRKRTFGAKFAKMRFLHKKALRYLRSHHTKF